MFIAIYSDESVLKDAATLDNFLRNSASFKLEHTKKNWFNKGWWYKKCWNNGPIKIFKWFFLGTLEIPPINFEITRILTWPQNCVISNATVNQATTFVIANTKLYAQVVTLSTDGSGKFLQQLKSIFKRTIDWNKNQSKPKH